MRSSFLLIGQRNIWGLFSHSKQSSALCYARDLVEFLGPMKVTSAHTGEGSNVGPSQTVTVFVQ